MTRPLSPIIEMPASKEPYSKGISVLKRLQQASASAGPMTAALARMKRMSLMRQHNRAKTAGSASELDAALADAAHTRSASTSGPPSARDSEKLDHVDEHGDPILGGELMVKVVDAQARSSTTV